jgi:hypothetical protein
LSGFAPFRQIVLFLGRSVHNSQLRDYVYRLGRARAFSWYSSCSVSLRIGAASIHRDSWIAEADFVIAYTASISARLRVSRLVPGLV